MSHRHKPSPPSGWPSRLKDPRIVRVSKAEGGASKDRHSKVCTVRGLRDRRVRLSVPTAIQLYDLQERLGLNQPSKVVDWLLNAAKHDIDELPPLSQVPIMMTMMMGSSSDPNSERISNFHAFRPEEDWVVDVKSSMDKIMTPDVTYNSIFRDASGFTLPRSLRVDQHENIPLQGPALSTNVPTFGFHHQQQDSRGVPPARDYGMQSTSQ